jgi:hypothetical protein
LIIGFLVVQKMKKPRKSSPRRLKPHKETVGRTAKKNRVNFAGSPGKKKAARPRRSLSHKEIVAQITEENRAYFAKLDADRSQAETLKENVGETTFEIITDENPVARFEEPRENPPEFARTTQLSHVCPHCTGEISYPAESRGLVSQCPDCKHLIILGRTVPSKDLPSRRDAFQPFFPSVKPRRNDFFCGVSIKFAASIVLSITGSFVLLVMICRSVKAMETRRNLAALMQQQAENSSQQARRKTPAYDLSSSRWTQGISANGDAWNSASAEAKWDLATRLAAKSKYGLTAQTFYLGLETTYNPSDAQALKAPIELEAQQIEESKNPNGYR